MNPTPQIPLNAPFNEAQRLWLNGYIAGIISQANSESNPSESSKNKIKQKGQKIKQQHWKKNVRQKDNKLL